MTSLKQTETIFVVEPIEAIQTETIALKGMVCKGYHVKALINTTPVTQCFGVCGSNLNNLKFIF